MDTPEIFAEAERQFTICNACRYCEGLCPVFPAMELRTAFTPGDIRYLANLCHDCRACEQACMFTPPHEFAITLPRILSEARMESYRHWSWPQFLAKLFAETSKGLILGFGAAVVVLAAGFYIVPSGILLSAHTGAGSFYEIVPYITMVIAALLLFVYGGLIWVQGGARFWIEPNSQPRKRARGFGPLMRAIRDSFTVKYLSGGGAGCSYPTEKPSQIRRVLHAAVFWGFLFDLLSTTLAFIYQDLLHRMPPYPLLSLPVVFGTLGGAGIVIGAAGLIVLKARSDRSQGAVSAYAIDYAFLVFLLLAALSGLLVLVFRSTAAMGALLLLHLGLVAGLFITAPYGKFVHFVYRGFALIRFQVESQHAKPQGGH